MFEYRAPNSTSGIRRTYIEIDVWKIAAVETFPTGGSAEDWVMLFKRALIEEEASCQSEF